MRRLLVLVIFSAFCTLNVCLPVVVDGDKEEQVDDETYFRRYLDEVSEILGNDPYVLARLHEFLQTNKTNLDDDELFWNMSVRHKLDALKHKEVERIRSYNKMQHDLDEFNKTHDYFVHHEPRFTSQDLRKLWYKAVKHYKQLDDLEYEKFKQHVEKEQEETVRRYADASAAERVKMIKEYKEAAARHKQHPKVHHPGSKAQMLEYWEKMEGMSPDSFNPKIIFRDLDINSDGVLDVYEISGLNLMELQKVYNKSDPDFDPWEENMDEHTMRNEFLRQYDHNNDLMVSYDEFMQTINSPNRLLDDEDDWKSSQDEEDMFETNEKALEELATKYKQKRQHDGTVNRSHLELTTQANHP